MPDVTIKTNKDIYAAADINGYPSEFLHRYEVL